MQVTALQGDSVDSLCWRHLGSSDAVETVLDTNPGLAALGPILPMGTVVTLPDAVSPSNNARSFNSGIDMSEEAQNVRLAALQEDISEIKAATRKMADAIERLARLEERQATVSSSIDRLFGAIGKLQERLGRLEAAQPVQHMTSTWVMDGAKFLAGAVAMFLLKKAGVL